MKLLVGRIMSAGVLVAAMAATAQARPLQALPDQACHQIGPSRYETVSDVGGPYMAPDYVPPRRSAMLLPPQEVYVIVRENGYAPLGLPQQRGVIYTIAVIDSYGEDGRLVIDARNGRIVRFQPAFRMGDEVAADMPASRPPASVPSPQAAVPTPPAAVPRPLASAPRRLASRITSVPLPKPTPPRAAAESMPAAPLAATPASAPAPLQQSAAVQPRAAEPTPPGLTTGQAPAKSSVQIMPTQRMPAAQGLD